MNRIAGILQPVFAIRTEEDLGIGDTEGVRQLIDWCARHELRVLQILPINETGPDPSPYNAISAMALEPSTLAVSPRHLPDLTEEDFRRVATPELLAELRQGSVNYPKVKALKRALFEAAFAQFTARHNRKPESYAKFIGRNTEWIFEYALFRALMELNGEEANWERWPEDHATPDRARTWLRALPDDRRAAFQRREQFFTYVQWIAWQQWEGLKAYAEKQEVELMGDVPIGIARGSADVWAQREIFDLDWSAGAPPEKIFKSNPFTEKWGQNWGSPLFKRGILRERDFDWWRERMKLAEKLYHYCRLDHVMGLFRIYALPWPPERNAEFLPLTEDEAAEKNGGRRPGYRPYPDDSPEHIAINQFSGEEMLHVLLDAAGKMSIVAEDLGHVPAYIRPTMQELEIPGFRIPALFRDPDGRYSDPAKYPQLSVVQSSTHDHPPLALAWLEWWQKIDQKDGTPENLQELKRLMQFAGLNETPSRDFTPRVHEAILRATLKAASLLAVILLPDVFAETTRFNVPGTCAEANWSARSPHTVAEMESNPKLAAKTESFVRLIRETGRAPQK